MAKWEIIEDIKFKKQTGGKTSAIKTEPKFKRKGKNNLNSTVEEELKNTVQVNQNGQVTEYDPSSPEYKKLYESGRLTSYDPKTDAYITPPLKEFTVVGEKPEWAKEKENNQSKYSKDWYIDNYLPKFSRNMGISANNMNPNDVERYNRIINDKTVEDIFKRYPLFDSDYANNRLETLKQLSPKEVELIKNSSYANKIEPSIWQDFEQGLLSFNSGPVQFKNENLTQEEAQEKNNPLGLLAPLSIPYNMTLGNVYTQQQGEKNYSWEKALKGQKPIYNSTAASIAGDPLNLLGLGLFKGLVSAGKIAKLEDAYQLVKGLGKEEALSKLKSLTSLDNYGREAFTPMLDNVGVEAFSAGKPPSFKSEINWAKWNKEIPENKALMQEYNAIEQQAKSDGTWMKNPDGSTFQGTPEQFVQQNSKNFKKAFPEGFENVFRGVENWTSSDILKPEKAMFLADKELASGYTKGNKILTYDDNFLKTTTKNSDELSKGIFNLAHKKSPNSIELDNFEREWTAIDLTNPKQSTDNINLNIKNLEKQIETQKNWFKTGKQNSDGSWSFPDSDVQYSDYLYKQGTKNQEKILQAYKNRLKNIDKLVKNPKELEKMKLSLGDKTTTDEIAKYIEDANLDYVKIKNVDDAGLGDVSIVNHKKDNYLKSLVGNNGMFDMTNPNIYKSVAPYIGYTGAGALTYKALQGQQQKYGGVIEDPMGQWAHPGSVTRIPSNQITMEGVDYPLLGISDTGHTQMMYPGEDYSFRGKSVTEYPMMARGGEVNFTYAGENHRVYEKVSPTGNGKGIEGHIMVNHPTENKKRWDTIDLTKITNGRVKTVPQGVASTKKWHKENPEYADGGRISSWEIIEDLPKAQNGKFTNPPIYVNNPNDPRLQMYSDSLSVYNKGEKDYKEYLNINQKLHIPSTSTRIELNPLIYDGNKPARMQPIESHRYWYEHSPDYIAGTLIPSNSVRAWTDRYKPPTQPYILQIQDHAQKQINMPIMGNINSNQQISQPINNIPTVIPPPKDYVTIKTGSSYRNPETGAFEQKTFKIDKVTGKKITEPAFQNGGKTKKSNWEIIEDSDELDEYKNGGKTSAWQRKEGKSPSGGLNDKGRASLKKEGHDIKPPQPEGGSRKNSFCARMSGMKKKLTGSKKANDPNSRINLSLKKWKC
jgi:hypothetical protein